MSFLSTHGIPPKLIQDTYLTLEDWNTLQDNEQEDHDVLGNRHVNSSEGDGNYAHGQHKSPEIPRAVMRTSVTVRADGFWLLHPTVAEGIASAERVGEGRWLFGITHANSDPTYGLAFTCAGGSASTLRDLLVTYVDGTANGGSFIGYEVTLLELDVASNSWELAEFPFVLTAFNAQNF